MDQKYRTSVRRAALLLMDLSQAHAYSSNFAEDKLINIEIEEVIQWLVDRDKRQRKRIKSLRIERYRNVTI